MEVETPVILLPSSPTTRDMLVAELGHFSLANHYVIQDDNVSNVVTGYVNFIDHQMEILTELQGS